MGLGVLVVVALKAALGRTWASGRGLQKESSTLYCKFANSAIEALAMTA